MKGEESEEAAGDRYVINISQVHAQKCCLNAEGQATAIISANTRKVPSFEILGISYYLRMMIKSKRKRREEKGWRG